MGRANDRLSAMPPVVKIITCMACGLSMHTFSRRAQQAQQIAKCLPSLQSRAQRSTQVERCETPWLRSGRQDATSPARGCSARRTGDTLWRCDQRQGLADASTASNSRVVTLNANRHYTLTC